MIIITEFDAEDPEATMHALADEILKYRRADAAAKAIGWADAGGPFALIAPGPRWRPRCTKSPTSRRLRRRLPDMKSSDRQATAELLVALVETAIAHGRRHYSESGELLAKWDDLQRRDLAAFQKMASEGSLSTVMVPPAGKAVEEPVAAH